MYTSNVFWLGVDREVLLVSAGPKGRLVIEVVLLD